jgi:succinate dehydrogenase / fumarate reductase membrane anchor subunit
MNPGNEHAAAHGGLRHWKYQRISSVLLIPLTAWLLWAIVQLSGADHVFASAFLARPFNAVMAIVTAAVMLYHAQSGIQVVCEDYVQPAWLQAGLIWLTRIGCLGGFIATLLAMYQVAPGA